MILTYVTGQRIKVGDKVNVANQGAATVFALIDPEEEAYAAWCAEMKVGRSVVLRGEDGTTTILDTTLGLERALSLVDRGA